ncbi:MAG: PAS domain-containing protein [Bdellovibrionales bacterium]|nr:PAS domain-containing protein [Ramlibacter sp.]
MLQTIDLDNDRLGLRQRALAHLSGQQAVDPDRATMSGALEVLHQLASSPTTAADALALLHELQVHQVELDMQLEELGNARADLEVAMARQTAMIENAPAGLLVLDSGTVLYEINLAGAQLLGLPREYLLGQRLDGLLAAPSALCLHSLLAGVREGPALQSCDLKLQGAAGLQRAVHAIAGKGAAPHNFQLVLMAGGPG